MLTSLAREGAVEQVPGETRYRLGRPGGSPAPRAGPAWVHDEFAEGLSSVAAPIADALGNVNAAVHVHGPSYRFPAPGAEEHVAEAVMAAAARISARIRE